MIEIKNLNKKYEKFSIDNLNLQIPRGEFLSILGKSGSGKSTLLNLISGSDKNYEGQIMIHGKSVSQCIKSGELAMVFQDSLLLPHLNVYENVAFGLRIRKLPKDEIDRRVRAILERLELHDLAKRFPSQLSGGQKQRVSIGRALVMNPTLLLMDEPFSALDGNLREKLQKMIKELHLERGLTILFVTHDRDEAFYLSDRIALMHHGKIVQLSSPKEMYTKPNSVYVAKFLGIDNIFSGEEFNRMTGSEKYSGKTLAIPKEDLRISKESRENSNKNLQNSEIDSSIFAEDSNSDEDSKNSGENFDLGRENILHKGESFHKKNISREKGSIRGIIKEAVFKTGFYDFTISSGETTIEVRQNRIDFPFAVGDEIFVNYRDENIIYIEGV